MSEKKFKNIPLPNNYKIKDYTITRRISSGGFSFVYLAENNITKETVVIKEYMPNSISVREKGVETYIIDEKDYVKFQNGLKLFFKEMSIISRIKHKNIIDIIDYFEMNNTAYIVTPYEYGMPLINYISNLKKDKTFIEEEDLLQIIVGILEAIKVLHEHDILHLDLKPNNIWLRSNKEILILDFGTSLDKNQVRLDNRFYTIGYAAPEQYGAFYKPLDIGFWTDYYGIGATLYHLITQTNATDSLQLKQRNESISILEDTPIYYHYNILYLINDFINIDLKHRQKINIDEMILKMKNIIPFSFKPDSLDNFLS